MNAKMEELVSIPSSVLINVMFCHQEDAYWPFGPPNNVKEVFNKLFNLKGYDDALKVIKDEQKKKEEKLKELQMKESYLKMFQEMGEKAAQILKIIHEAERVIMEKTAELKPLKEEYTVPWNELEKQKVLETEEKFLLKECRGDTKKLKNISAASMRQQMASKEDEIESKQKEIEEIENEKMKLQETLASLKTYIENCHERDTIMRKMVHNLGISEAMKLPSKITKESFTVFQEKVQKELYSLARQQEGHHGQKKSPTKGKSKKATARIPQSAAQSQPMELESDAQELLNLQNFILKLIRKHGEDVGKTHQYDDFKASLQSDKSHCPLCHQGLNIEKTKKLLLELEQKQKEIRQKMDKKEKLMSQEVKDGLSGHQLVCCSERMKMIQESFDDVVALNETIEKDEEAFAQVQIDFSNADREVTKVQREINKLDERKLKLEQKIDRLEKAWKELDVNIKYKEKEEEVTSWKKTIQKKYAGKTLTEKCKEMSSKMAELEKEINKKQGVLDEKVNERKVAEEAIESEDCKNAADDGKLYWGKIEIYDKACNDLEIYGNALKLTIIEYHAMMMEKINTFIGTMWKGVYKGKDIDFIEIEAEALDMTKRSSCNYRVVMVKGSKRMDMKERCSAGQKVLACVIIRLALAEALGYNCKWLALDEPTTNLDSEHIEALADALVGIVKSHERQQNFQLIVITHNEHFVECLRQAKLTDYCYKIYKNDEGKSVAKKEKM